MKTRFYSDKDETHYHKKVALGLVLKVAVFGTWKWPIEQRAYDELHCRILVENRASIKPGTWNIPENPGT